MSSWNADQIPDQTNRQVIVTGANTGIGYETVRALAHKGAHVVLACRNADKGQEAVTRLEAERPRGTVALEVLDLSDLESVSTFASRYRATRDRLDLLVNNAGVMTPPFGRTRQGFELQHGTNHLGHFALTGHLLPTLRTTAGSRVVVVYSSAYRTGRIAFDDLDYNQRPYRAWQAYGQSKLANLLFASELQRRLQKAGATPIVTGAHPGWTATDLQRSSRLIGVLNPLFAMNAPQGALPTLRAATDPDAAPGSFWAPSRFFELNGPPEPAFVAPHGRDPEAAQRLWGISEALTGVRYDLAA